MVIIIGKSYFEDFDTLLNYLTKINLMLKDGVVNGEIKVNNGQYIKFHFEEASDFFEESTLTINLPSKFDSIKSSIAENDELLKDMSLTWPPSI
jgi:hypothetical protein